MFHFCFQHHRWSTVSFLCQTQCYTAAEQIMKNVNVSTKQWCSQQLDVCLELTTNECCIPYWLQNQGVV